MRKRSSVTFEEYLEFIGANVLEPQGAYEN